MMVLGFPDGFWGVLLVVVGFLLMVMRSPAGFEVTS